MKVVLFCGGLGMRIRNHAEDIPKPMVTIGYRPILWHVMRYYAYFGHKDFILCLGYRGDAIKRYFLSYNEALTNDFVLSNGGGTIELLARDIEDWRITFVDTGQNTCVGGRLLAIQSHVAGEEMFLANYSDTVTDANLDVLVAEFQKSDAASSFLCVKPTSTFHVVSVDQERRVREIRDVKSCDLWINGGYFAFRTEIFDYLRQGEELVEEPFHRLIRQGRLLAYRHTGFWACMDTFKDKEQLEALHARGVAPWEIWHARNPGCEPGTPG